jgi:GWxTD domain-containing protein
MAHVSRRLPFILSLTLLSSTAVGQKPLQDLFSKGKEEFRAQRYEEALAVFKLLDELSQAPEFAASRKKLEPNLAFYRGAAHAALGHQEAARMDFEICLAAFPTARLDPGVFPKGVIKLFEKTRDDLLKESPAPTEAGDTSLAAAYEKWKRTLPPESADVVPKARWAESALRIMMTKEEKSDWERLDDELSRARFIAAFWQRRNPDPTRSRNELREELERRLEFANLRFVQGEKPGAETDRGLVFVLLGPPTYVGQTILTAQDDQLQSLRASPLATSQGTDSRGRRIVSIESRAPLTAETLQGIRDTWHYRRDHLHKAIGFASLDVEFITTTGYGEAVLQRDQNTLSALGQAARSYLPKEQ